MTFHHVPVKGSLRLIATYCAECKHCLAVGTQETLLEISEKYHKCLGKWHKAEHLRESISTKKAAGR